MHRMYDKLATASFRSRLKFEKNVGDTFGSWLGFRYQLEGGLFSKSEAVRTRAMMLAASNGCTDIVQRALKLGYDINTTDMSGKTMLHYAAANGQADCVQKLLELRADSSLKDRKGKTALDCAINRQSLDVIPMLVGKSTKRETVLTGFFNAAASGKLEALQAIAAHAKVNLNVKEKTGSKETALHKAARGGHNHVIEWLANEGVSINARNAQKETALHLAAANDHQEALFKLTGRKAYLNARDSEGMTPLMKASRAGAKWTVSSLASLGANVNIQDKMGRTALHHVVEGAKSHDQDAPSIQKGLACMGTLFNQKGIKPFRTNKHGNDVAHLVGGYGQKAFVPLLERAGLFFTQANNKGQTPVELALFYKHLKTARAMSPQRFAHEMPVKGFLGRVMDRQVA